MAKIIIKGQNLIAGIQKVTYARNKDKDLKNKPISGILLSLRKNKLNLVAIDGHRLALYSIPVLTPESSELVDVVISEKTAKEIIKKIKKKKDVEIEIDNNKLIIDGENVELMQGMYPNYEDLYVSEDFDIEIVVPKEELLDAINKVVKEKPFEKGFNKYDIVKFTLVNDDKKLIITGRNHESPFEKNDTYNHAEIDVSINFNYFFYEGFIIFFNNAYIQEAVKPIESENVIIRLMSEYGQAEFTDGFNYSALVMPKREW